jgi:pimeloyl-ACP methyl ester carboxylesterase
MNQMSLSHELPEKFFLHGHSYGGYISALFACAHPDRIQALFLNSAIGAEPEPTDEYDPLYIRLSSSHE